MSSVDFEYNGEITTIQCDEKDKIEDIFQRFCIKTENNKDNLYLIYAGNIIDQNNSLNEIANKEDKKRKKLSIIIQDKIESDNTNMIKDHLKKAKYIICPKCSQNISIKIKDYQIQLVDCKNGHTFENLSFSDFEESQLFDESKIICDICKTSNKSKTYKNIFYICYTCKKNICPLCALSHDKNHILIDYSQKDFKCHIHNDSNIFYCTQCKSDLCIICEKEHSNHNKISFGEILPDKQKLEEDRNNLWTAVEQFEKDIQNIIQIFNEVVRNIQFYYNLYDNIINNYEIQNRNYIILQNINYFSKYNISFISELKKIIENNNLSYKFENIINMFNQMNKQNKILGKKENPSKKETNSKNESIEHFKSINKNKNDLNTEMNIKDKFENFNIEKIKKVKSLTKKKSFDKAINLNDKRLLLFSHNGDLAVYNTQKNKSFYKEINGLIDIGKLSDGNLILSQRNNILKVIKIEGDNISIIQETNIEISKPKLYLLSNEKILIYQDDKSLIHIYSYKDKKLNNDNLSFDINKKRINSICEIKENELGISCLEFGKLDGYNNYVLFYNIIKGEITKTIEVSCEKLCLLSEKYLMALSFSKIYLVDLIQKKIINSISSKNKEQKSYSILGLNEKTFIVITGNIYQYEIKNENIVYKGSNLSSSGVVAKLPGNKLLVESFGGLDIYQ